MSTLRWTKEELEEYQGGKRDTWWHKTQDRPLPKPKISSQPELERQLGLTGREFVAEHRFHETRRWRFDIAFPKEKLAVEIEGGVWTEGRHTRGAGFVNDMEKYNEALIAGWRVLRVTPDMVKDGRALQLIERAL